jgi:hypothetical protein
VRVVPQERLGEILSALPAVPRVVAGRTDDGTKVPGVADLKP